MPGWGARDFCSSSTGTRLSSFSVNKVRRRPVGPRFWKVVVEELCLRRCPPPTTRTPASCGPPWKTRRPLAARRRAVRRVRPPSQHGVRLSHVAAEPRPRTPLFCETWAQPLFNIYDLSLLDSRYTVRVTRMTMRLECFESDERVSDETHSQITHLQFTYA